MLRIITSGFGGGSSDRLRREISELIAKRERAYLIVPEQQTVMAEGEYSVCLPDYAPLFFEVTNFTRFANTTFRALGGLCGEYCTSAKKSLIMWRALEELSPVITLTAGGGEVGAGLVDRMLRAVGELQSQGITPDMLELIAERADILSDKRLQSKVCDLSKIYTLYKSLLSRRYADTGDDAAMMAERLAAHPDFLSDTAVFIDGFTSFTKPQYDLIRLLASRTAVTVTLCLPKHSECLFEYGELQDTLQKLLTEGRMANSEIKHLHESDNLNNSSEVLATVSASMWRNFRNFDKISLQNPEELRIIEARTPFEECDFIASDIKRRVIGGARYSDFAIVARSSDKYAGILDNALALANVPYFASYKKDASSFEAVKLIYAAYSAIRSGFAREDVLTYSKCANSGVTTEERDELEAYVNKWQITGRRFTDGRVWNMNPAGYDINRSANADATLARIHETRTRLITPLSDFADEARAAETVREQATALVRFLTRIDLEGTLLRRSEELAAMGEASFAEENLRLWSVICDALDQLVEVNGDFRADTESFVGQLKVLFSSADIGRIPSVCDEVTVGDADMLRLQRKPHIYLLGVRAGEFPATPTDSDFFTERDRLALDALDMKLRADSDIKCARELYYFTRAFSYASESITVLYSSCDARFKSVERAQVIDKIIQIVDGLNVTRLSDLTIEKSAWVPAASLVKMGELRGEERETLRRALNASGYEALTEVANGDITNSAMRLQEASPYRIDTPIALTQSRLDSFRGCPLEHFCRYTVRLTEEEIAEFDASGVGTFIHAILEYFFTSLREQKKRAGDLTAKERADLTEEAVHRYIGELGEDAAGSPRVRIKLERLCRAARPVVDGLCSEFAESKFEPRFFELAIRREGDGPRPVSIKNEQGAETFIYGVIDRVDTYESAENLFVRVVDYKTGKKEFSPEELAEGKNLQMFLYLRAITESPEFAAELGVPEGGKAVPAGVIYVKTNVSDTKIRIPSDSDAEEAVRASQGREGMVLSDPDIIAAMGINNTPLASKSGDGTLRREADKYTYDAAGWEKLSKDVETAVNAIADGIRSGDASATPATESGGRKKCEYCKFKPICRKPEIK